MMKLQSVPRRASSPMSAPVLPVLRLAGVKAVSVTPKVPPMAWTVVAQATIPVARVAEVTEAAELLQPLTPMPVPGFVASNLMTTEVTGAGVSVLVAKSTFTSSDTNPFGVTGQEQQDIICSSCENAYTFAQMAPVV